MDHNGLAFIITDGNPLSPGSGCVPISSYQVSCAGIYGKQVTLNLGDYTDSTTVTAAVPASSRVTLNGDGGGTAVFAGSAVAAVDVNSTAGDVTTGAGSDVLNIGGGAYQGNITTGAGADSLTITTTLPKVTFDPETEDSPYPGGTTYLNESWPVYIHTDDGPDYIDGAASSGAFWYEAAGGCDLIIGGAGDDWFNAGVSGSGDDTIIGGAGNDKIYSYENNDGDDMYYGGVGNDTINLWNNPSEETFHGGPGIDAISYQQSVSGTTALTLDGIRNDGLVINGASGNDNWTPTVERIGGDSAHGGAAVVGTPDSNLLSGYIGPDIITGGAGSDNLQGFQGDDTIYARDGQVDTVDCGTGASDIAYLDATDTNVGGRCEITP